MSSFNAFPHNVLICIRYHIAGDIATHVALSQTCRQLRSIYADDDNAWKAICFSAGFGRPKRHWDNIATPSAADNLSWREIAHVLSKHATWCEIRTCKDANACFAEHYQAYARFSTPITLPLQSDITLHPLYFYLHFAEIPTSHAYIPFPDALTILLTLLPTFPECKLSQYGPLCSHPNASCAFATFPPVASLSFQDADGCTFLVVENPDGCTILDVNRALAELIPRDVVSLETALAHYRELMQTSGLSSAQFADRVSRQKGFLGDHEYPFLPQLAAQPWTGSGHGLGLCV